jgi:hypothetical protein
MATTTVAAGRIRNKANEGLPTPDGWVLDAEGKPSNDPLVAKQKGGFLTSLGGSPENSSYKGYGLAVMVNVLASCLSGATLITDPLHTKKPVGMDIGHFFLAIDPRLFREADDFQADVATFMGALRATTPIDPASSSSFGTGSSSIPSPVGRKAKTWPACQPRAVLTDLGIEIWNFVESVAVSLVAIRIRPHLSIVIR